MFGQFLYVIIALLLFTLQQPGKDASFGPVPTVLLSLGLFLIFFLCSYLALRPMRDEDRWQNTPQAVLSLYYHRTLARLNLAAIVNVALFIYVLNVKYYLQQIPGMEQSSTLEGVTGLCLYLLHASTIWVLTHSIHRRLHHSQTKLAPYVMGHLSFIAAILLPWLLISIILDLLQWMPVPEFLRTDPGELVLLGAIMLLFMLFGPGLVVRLWGCRPLPDTPLRKEIEQFCRDFRFRVGDFKLWPLFGGEALTAAIIGILPRWRYILITRNLLTLLNAEELKAVVAHEMGHVRRYHLLLYVSFFLCYSALAYYLNDILLLLLLRQPAVLKLAMDPDTISLNLFSIVYSLPALLLLVIYFRFIFGYFMRNCERQADVYAMQQVGHPYTLISSLEKIAICSGATQEVPSWHHYSIGQRIRFLQQASQDATAVARHNRRLYRAVAIFFTSVAILIASSLYLKETKPFRNWQSELQLDIVENRLREYPGQMEYYAAYGGILLEMGRYADAEAALRDALRLAPENAWIINNLAWLYATSPPPYSNPAEAVQLARNAADLNPDPQILDTLAEAYFADGQTQLALETIQRAIEGQPRDLGYFLRQLQKFQTALKNQHSGGE